MPASKRYSFGDYTLDLERGALLKLGSDVKLRPKSFEVLRLLVERHGQLVSKEDLITAVWPRTVVTEGALGQCLIDVRRAIGDESQVIIRTVPRRGYLFDVPVIESDGAQTSVVAPQIEAPPAEVPPAHSAGRTPQVVLVALLAIVAAAAIAWLVFFTRSAEEVPPRVARAVPNSIAVLPFVNMSSDPAQEYFSDGISEEILNLLAATPQLQVIARTSSFSFKGENADIAQIASKLKVAYVLEGSVRKADNRVRITAQLIAAETSAHLWSQTYDRTLDDILVVQSDIAAAVAEALKTQLLGREAASSATKSGAAYERYLQGNFFFGRRASGDLYRAATYYRQALELDPDYARAWAGIAAVANIRLADGAISLEEGLPQVREAAEKAIALDPNLAEPHVRLANYYELRGDLVTAKRHFEKAVALAPQNVLVLSGQATHAATEMRLDDSIAGWRQVVKLDPLSAINRGNLGYTLFTAGRLDEAKAELLGALDMNPELERGTIALILILQRDFDAAGAWLRQVTGADEYQGLAMLNHALGRTAQSDAALASLIETASEREPVRIAEVYAYRGDVDQSFKWLQVVLDQQARFDGTAIGGRYGWELLASPFLKSLQSDPRWAVWSAEVQRRTI